MVGHIFFFGSLFEITAVNFFNQEDRENILRARASGKGVLTAPFRLLKTNRLGVILTFTVYKKDLLPNATPEERIAATDG